MGFRDRLKHGFDAFLASDKRGDNYNPFTMGAQYSSRPDRPYRTLMAGDRTIMAGIYTRMAIDVASVDIKHIKVDEQGRFKEELKTALNERFTLEANLDQAATHFKQDIAETLFDKGVCAIVPVETSADPMLSSAYDIKQLRVGEIVAWFPAHVRVSLYNQRTGQRQEVNLPKKTTAIVQNPLYNVMNEPNGTLARIQRKLALLDSVDEQSSNGKLDMIIQLPYQIRTDSKEAQARKRQQSLEEQLKDSKYGIGYIDATEKITQLNRPIENNMLKQIEYLMGQLYAQLGITAAVFNGEANEQQLLNYQNRTIAPILQAIVESMRRTFLSRTARTQGQTIVYLQDPFKLLPLKDLAEIADKFTRNEIMSANEIRGKLGMGPSSDPKADQLVNSNLKAADTGVAGQEGVPAAEPAVDDASVDDEEDSTFNSTLDDLDKQIEEILNGGGSA